ncbi:hypothetical protein ACOJIV_25025 [Haloarcula sp. AONF1]
MTRVPDHMIPAGPAVLGDISVGPPLTDEDRKNALAASNADSNGVGPSIDDLPECPHCECPLVGCLEADTMTCPECGVELPTPAANERARQDERERQRWNDQQKFLPMSPSEWDRFQRRRGDRR